MRPVSKGLSVLGSIPRLRVGSGTWKQGQKLSQTSRRLPLVPFLEKRLHFSAVLLCDRDILLPREAKEWSPRTTQYPLEGDQLCPVALGARRGSS